MDNREGNEWSQEKLPLNKGYLLDPLLWLANGTYPHQQDLLDDRNPQKSNSMECY